MKNFEWNGRCCRASCFFPNCAGQVANVLALLSPSVLKLGTKIYMRALKFWLLLKLTWVRIVHRTSLCSEDCSHVLLPKEDPISSILTICKACFASAHSRCGAIRRGWFESNQFKVMLCLCASVRESKYHARGPYFLFIPTIQKFFL